MNIAECSKTYAFGSMAYRNKHALRDRGSEAGAYQSSVEEDVLSADRAQAGMSVQDAYEKMSNPARRLVAVSSAEAGQEMEQETGTKSEIIVKPDGSKVLIMTMNVGGMQTQMSLEISKPTNMLDDHAAQEHDGNAMAVLQEEMVSDSTYGIIGGA